jgi:hypothetical protein
MLHYFTIPSAPFSWREAGELFPAPSFIEAMVRGLMGITGAAVVTAAAWGAGSVLLRRARAMFVSGGERVSFELAIGCGALSYTCLILAFAGLYRPMMIVSLLVVLGVVGIGLWLSGPHTPPGGHRTPPRLRELVLTVCALAACAFALAGALAPETEFDALWYHLWLPARWLATGHPVDILSEYVSLYPLTWELLFGAAMTIGGDVAAKLLHFGCLMMVGVTTAMFARRWFPGTSGVTAAVLALTVPVMIWEGTTAYIDLAVAWYVVAGAYALLRHDETRDRRWLLLGAVSMGIAAAIKNLALVFFAIAGVTLAVRQLSRANARQALRVSILFGVLALLVPSPWYARAWLRSGNPVFPDLYDVFGARPPERWDADVERELRRFKDRFGADRSAAHLLSLPWDVTMHGTRYGGTLGPVFLLLAPVGMIAAAGRRAPRARILVLCAAIAAYGLVWASPLSSFQLRFLVPLVPFVAVLAAEGLRRLPSLAWVITGLLLIWNLPPFTPWHEADKQGWSGWLTHTMRLVPLPVLVGAEPGDDYLARKVPSYRAWQYIDEHVPPGSRVLTFSAGDHLYSRTPRIWSDTPLARPATWGALSGDEQAARAALARLGVTHVLFDKRQFADPNFTALAIASPAMRACCLAQVYDDGRFAVYRVR